MQSAISPKALRLVAALVSALASPGAAANDAGAERSVEDIARAARDSVLVVRASDRAGEARGLGSGFIVREDGVLVTNYHVIGERRPFTVHAAGGAAYRPTAILAADEELDIAIVKIEAQALPALSLGDSDALVAGQTVMSVGNPLGLELSVSRGVVAEPRREVAGRTMIQVAMPIEPGSSGSPLIDLRGEVVGVIAIKSAAALGFAVPSRQVRALLERSRPVAIERWLTVGSIDAARWEILLGGTWRQRAGRIVAAGAGTGFGGRTLCLSRGPAPEGDFEIEVEVKLGDESGAAGLAFAADGGELHYGFYPTNGALRLTRFAGPDVLQWTILDTRTSSSYRPGDWNRIGVRVERTRMTCLINGDEVVTLDDGLVGRGRVGLVKFREPPAEFRGFRVGTLRDRQAMSPADRDAILRLAQSAIESGEAGAAAVDELAQLDADATAALEARAKELERGVLALRALADRARRRRIEHEIVQVLAAPEAEIDLLRASLLVARIDNPGLDIEPYLGKVESMARAVRERAGAQSSPSDTLDHLIHYVFAEEGFHGSTADYYHRSNSYLNEVLDDREGLPITLAIVFIELARRLDLEVAGVGVPAHFICKFTGPDGAERLIDVYGEGAPITRADAERLSGRKLEDTDFVPATKRAIVERVLHNLLRVAQAERDGPGMLRYLDVLISIAPDDAQGRWLRAQVRAFSSDRHAAVEDLDWLLERRPPGIDIDEVRAVRDSLRRRAEL